MSTGPQFSSEALLASLPAKMARAAQAVVPAIADAARRTGADFGALFKMARLESGFRANASAAASSATGLFQFIDSTWLQTLRKHGAEAGIGDLPRAKALQLRNDPQIASLMAAHHMADNAAILQQALGRAPTDTDLYVAHFLGVGGASKFLRGLASTPDASAASMFPAAARANPAIFYQNGAPRSLAAVHQLLESRLNATPAPAPLPATLQAQLATTQGAPAKTGTAIAPAAAAQLAYLLLADLGG